MAGTKITTSANIALLDSRIFANICNGQFTVDLSPSVFLGSGASVVLGAKVQITNPYGVVIKAYTGSYDIATPVTGSYTHAIPTQATKKQYGIYTIEVQLTDADNATYTISKRVNVCTYTSDSHPCDERLRVVADCKNGRVDVAVAEPPVFKGKYADSSAIDLDVYYPTASGLTPIMNSTYSHFSLQLFQGVYKFVLNVCAVYDMGDNIFLNLPYDVTLEKNVKCLLDYSCIYPAIERLHDKIAECNSQKDKEYYSSLALQAVLNLQTAEIANQAGEDASKYIDDLEKILGCQCTCDCSGSPIVNNSPATNVAIEGCAVEQATVGLTTVFTINAKNYYLTVDDSDGILGISAVSEYGCVAYQQLSVQHGPLYNAIKSQIANSTEYNFWASVINNTLNSIDALCLGYNPSQWTALTFVQKITAIKVAACSGGVCTTSVSGVNAQQSGTNVIIYFTQSGGFSADVYVDGILQGNVLAGVGQFTVPNKADGLTHTYAVVPKCSNGAQGTVASGSFGFLACPSIAPPSVSQSTLNNVTCPYDLTTLIYPEPPIGIEVEWHTANNTLSSTLVADAANVSSGVYYAFAKNADGCYSTATQVTLICDGGTTITAPQNLLVEVGVGGNKVSFQSAAYPPPSNSYTVKRKAAADPDIDGSYTTIGSPVWNSSTSRWEITDATASANTLYTYKAQSNGGGNPYVLYNFANLDCPTLTLTPGVDEMDYEFVPVSGSEVDKYEVTIWDSTGAIQLQADEILPAFSNPVTGTFTYLDDLTTYKVRVKVFIGTFSKTCDFATATTGAADTISANAFMNLANPSMSGTIQVTTPGGRTLRFSNFSVCGLANASVTISGGIGTINNNLVSGTPNDDDNVDTLLPVGSYTFSGTLSAGCTSVASITFV